MLIMIKMEHLYLNDAWNIARENFFMQFSEPKFEISIWNWKFEMSIWQYKNHMESSHAQKWTWFKFSSPSLTT